MAVDKVTLPTDGSGKNLAMVKVNISGVDYYFQSIITTDSAGNPVGITGNPYKVDGSAVTQPASIANGSDVTQGAIADSAYSDVTGAASGSIIALLKGIFKILAAALGKGTATVSAGAPTTTSAQLVAANTSRKSVLVRNNSTVNIYLNFGATAATNTDASIVLEPGDAYYEDKDLGAITCRTATGTASVTIIEVA